MGFNILIAVSMKALEAMPFKSLQIKICGRHTMVHPRGRRRRSSLKLILALLVLVVGGGEWGCSTETKGQTGPRAVPVLVDTVTQRNIPVELRAIGNVEAYTTVSIKSMVAGQVVRVGFAEGQDVKVGDLLFMIDPRSFEASVKQAEANLAKDVGQVRQAEANLARDLAQVKQAEANLARDTAQSETANVQAERYRLLVERKVVSQQQSEQFITSAKALDATVLADKAAVDNANAVASATREAIENARAAVQGDQAALENATIQLGYCSIHSPINGRTGNLLIHQGDTIKANDTLLVVINQINPIYVTFSIPEKDLPEVKKYMAMEKLRTDAILPHEEKPADQGTLSFVDNTVDATTGTIQLKGTFPNQEKRLWPGQFVNVVLRLTTQPDAVVVSANAIQTGQDGQFVFVVRADHTVESRSVVVSRMLGREAIVGKGLNPGETVVTDGQLQLVSGSKIEIKKPALNGTGGGQPS
jgi:multidrug efflux system membrane fusion protein